MKLTGSDAGSGVGVCRPGWDGIDERAITSGGVRRHHIFSGSASDSFLGLALTSSGELSSQNDRRDLPPLRSAPLAQSAIYSSAGLTVIASIVFLFGCK